MVLKEKVMSKAVPKPTSEQKKIAKTLELTKDTEIAYDFAEKVYQKIGTPIKSIILFGSAAKGISKPKSDIDLIIVIDDASIQWDDELIAWYREELGKIIKSNPYVKPLHVNTVRLTTWWDEMMRGEPVVTNIIRWGVPLIDFGGFLAPLKALLAQGRIKSTPEMIYITLGRSPSHMARCKVNMISGLEALYWAFVDSSHAAIIAAKASPPSPEHIPQVLKSHLVDKKLLNSKYVDWYREIYLQTHKVLRGEITDVDGKELQLWRDRADEYIREMAIAIKKITGKDVV